MNKKRVVIKIGSSLLTGKNGCLDYGFIAKISAEIAKYKLKGYEIILVSSGAIVAGMNKLELCGKRSDLREKQAAASVGQVQLMQMYEKVFGEKNIVVAQVLLTRQDLEDRTGYLNIRNTLLTLLKLGVLPIINENDTVAVEEIKFGDNDTLSAIVASKVNADNLVMLTDVDGLFTGNPKKSSEAELINEIKKITPEIVRLAGKDGCGELGTGGMETKIQAARITMASGVTLHIVNGRKEDIISSVLDGKKVGTKFVSEQNKLAARERWIAFGMRLKGQICVDDGAAKAVLEKGKSLLPSGIVSVTGNFEVGDMVGILNCEGKEIARGLVNYAVEDIKKIKGCNTNEIIDVLGYKSYDEIIHRDNLVPM